MIVNRQERIISRGWGYTGWVKGYQGYPSKRDKRSLASVQ